MITKLPIDVKADIRREVHNKFNVKIDNDIIDFMQDFQSKMAVEGFANKEEVRFFNLAVFKYNPKKIDSRNTMKRLLNKHGGDAKKALKEFRVLGKIISIEEQKQKAYEKEHRVVKPRKHDKIRSNSMFTAV